MSKKVAVIAFNPVNGMGLFQYLESFFENGIEYKCFAIAGDKAIKTNSGIEVKLDGTVADLKGHETEYDALVLACGDAMLNFGEIANSQLIKDAFAIIASFNKLDKLIIGHCAAPMMFDMAGVTLGKQLSIHPYGKDKIVHGIATDNDWTVDANLYTAKCEDHIYQLIPSLLDKLI